MVHLQGPLRAAASFMCQTTATQKRMWQQAVGFADTAHFQLKTRNRRGSLRNLTLAVTFRNQKLTK